MSQPVRLSFFHDVLCAFCSIAASRVRRLEEEFGDDLLVVELRPFALKPEAAVPTGRDVRRQIRLVKQAAREPEGVRLSPAVWRGIDPPLTSMPPLVAAEAALLQGQEAQRVFVERLRETALRGGVNVSRRDVLFEAAAAAGLDMDRFAIAFDAPATLRAVEESRRHAMRHGVTALPSVVIGDEWLLTGVRQLEEYRDALLRWLERRGGGGESPRMLN